MLNRLKGADGPAELFPLFDIGRGHIQYMLGPAHHLGAFGYRGLGEQFLVTRPPLTQWSKNVFLFAGLVFGYKLTEWRSVLATLLGFVCFSLLAGATLSARRGVPVAVSELNLTSTSVGRLASASAAACSPSSSRGASGTASTRAPPSSSPSRKLGALKVTAVCGRAAPGPGLSGLAFLDSRRLLLLAGFRPARLRSARCA